MAVTRSASPPASNNRSGTPSFAASATLRPGGGQRRCRWPNSTSPPPTSSNRTCAIRRARAPPCTRARRALDSIDRAERVEQLDGRERLVAVHKLLTPLIDHLERLEGLNVSFHEDGRV